MTIIDRILDLMDKNNINAATLSRDISLTNGLITQWKKGKQKPSTDAIIKLATFFNVSTDYLLLGEEKTSRFLKDINPNLPSEELSMSNDGESYIISDISSYEKELLENYKKLDSRGQHRIHTIIYEELDRMEENKNISDTQKAIS